LKIKTIRDKKYMEWIKTLPCIICQRNTPSDPHHTKTGGKGIKACDYTCVPLCHKHHVEIHTVGTRTFQRIYDVDFDTVCERLVGIYKNEPI
jgi:hypothetical protein